MRFEGGSARGCDVVQWGEGLRHTYESTGNAAPRISRVISIYIVEKGVGVIE